MKQKRKLWNLFYTFLKIGSFTFGGGLAMIPLIQKEVVDKQKWVKEKEILDIIAISQSTPGVISVNISILVGKRVSGFRGAVVSVLGVTLPAFFSIIVLLMFLSSFENNVYVSKIFSGIKAASCALILVAAVKLGKSALAGKSAYFIALISFFLIIIFGINAAWAVVFGGVAGWIFYSYNRRNK